MDYQKLERATKALLEPHPHLNDLFETTLREAIASQDLHLLLSNSLPTKVLANCVAMSLRTTSERATRDSLTSIATQLWNPIIDSMLQMLAKSVSSVLAKPDPGKSKQTVNKKKPVVETRSKEPAVPADPQEVRDQLKQNANSASLFSAKCHNHISCTSPSCKFCNAMYRQVHITRCVGHAPCHPTGFYPHVGKPLWNMLKTKHNKTMDCKLKIRPCKKNEIPCLDYPEDVLIAREKDCDKEEQQSPLDWTEDSQDADLEEEIYYPSPSKRRLE